MIEINLNTARFKLEVKGHAQPEETKEYSEVCAAVSALAQGLVYTVTKYESDHEAIGEMDYRNDPGDFLWRVKPDPWAEALIRKRMYAYGDGLEMMAACHPESVKMIYDGEEVQPFTEEGKSNGEQETADH